MRSARDAHAVSIVGGVDSEEVTTSLKREGFVIVRHDQPRQARASSKVTTAPLLIIGRTGAWPRAAALCWHLRMAGYCGRSLVVLNEGHYASAADLVRAGADDALSIPAGADEILRRVAFGIQGRTAWVPHVAVGELAINCAEHSITFRGAQVPSMPPTAYGTLNYVARYGRNVVPWDELARQVVRRSPSPDTARKHLAAALARLGTAADLFEVIHGVGCRIHPRFESEWRQENGRMTLHRSA